LPVTIFCNGSLTRDKGFIMKPKSKSTLLATKDLIKANNSENEKRLVNWQKIGLRLAAIFLIIVFLASECATLLPMG
jgi:hypothetical protein